MYLRLYIRTSLCGWGGVVDAKSAGGKGIGGEVAKGYLTLLLLYLQGRELRPFRSLHWHL